MHIVLVKPCWQYPIAGADHTYNRRWPPLDLLNCGAILQEDGHQVQLVDAQAERLSPERVVSRVGSADMVFVTSSALDRWQCPTLELAPLTAVTASLRDCTEKLFLLGFHGTVKPEAMLRMTGVDAVVRGEPERTVQAIAAGRQWEKIAGLTFDRDGDAVSTPDRHLLDMTKLPVPAFALIEPSNYQYEILGSRFMVLEGTRGCPYPCTFCSRVIQGRQYRRKTATQLGHEVEIAVREHGVKSIYFIDLEFTGSAEIAEGISQYMLDHEIRVPWCCQTRADLVDESLLTLMKRAGCRLLHLGVEAGSPRIARNVRKQITIDEQRRAVALARRLGIETLCFFLLGYPGETTAEMHDTIRLATELNPTYVSFHRVSPYAGTQLYDDYAGESEELFPAFAGSKADRQQVDRMVREAFWSFYMRPGYILSRIFRSSPCSLWRQLRLFAGYFS